MCFTVQLSRSFFCLFDSLFTLPHLPEVVKDFFQVFSSFRCVCHFRDSFDSLSCFQIFVNKFFIFLKTVFIMSKLSIHLFVTTQLGYTSFFHMSTTFLFFRIFFHFFPNIIRNRQVEELVHYYTPYGNILKFFHGICA